MTDDRHNALLVVAALLLTVTYQVALSAPAEAQKAIHFNSTAPMNTIRDPFVQLLNPCSELIGTQSLQRLLLLHSNSLNKYSSFRHYW
jgi:hypothetical protein